MYYRWFYINPKTLPEVIIEKIVSRNLKESCWIDSLQKQVFIRTNAQPELIQNLDGKFNNMESECTESFLEMYDWLKKIFY